MEVITASCPECSAQYQLTQEQLSVANGQVRCGACMTVFQAVPAKQQATPPPPKPKPKPKPEKPDSPSKSSYINDEDERLLSDTGVRNSFDKTSNFATGEFSTSFDDLDETGGLGLDDDISFDDSTSFDDDSATFDDNSTFDDDATFDDSSSFDSLSSLGDELSDEFESSDDSFGDDILLSDEADLISQAGLEDADESWAEQLLDEEDLPGNEPSSDSSAASQTGSPSQKDSGEPKAALGALGDDFDFEADLDGLELGSLSKNEEEDLGFSDKDEIIDRITPEPLVFHLFQQDSLAIKIIYGVASLVAICLFIVQLFYFQFETMSRDPDWRSLYETSCSILGCELPEQYSINDISARHLTVKSHPYYKKSLIVDTIITNHADILQPFPNLELFFTDTSQKIVSARKFKPEEYLRGELASTSIMPSKQSIHIALEINDPGKKATGYWIQLTY